MAKKVRFELDYDIGDLVYLKTDPELLQRIVIEIRLTEKTAIYILGCGSDDPSEHYSFEIVTDKPVD